jgi:hypothetical protein
MLRPNRVASLPMGVIATGKTVADIVIAAQVQEHRRLQAAAAASNIPTVPLRGSPELPQVTGGSREMELIAIGMATRKLANSLQSSTAARVIHLSRSRSAAVQPALAQPVWHTLYS